MGWAWTRVRSSWPFGTPSHPSQVGGSFRGLGNFGGAKEASDLFSPSHPRKALDGFWNHLEGDPSNFLGHPLAHSRIWSYALGGKNLALRLVFSWSLLSSWDQIRRIPNGSSPSRPSPSPRAQQASAKEAARLAGRPRSARADR